MTFQRYIQNRRSQPGKKGFTLLELIVVITIIGLLGTLVVTKVIPILFKANRTKITIDLQAIVKAAKGYYADQGSFPETLADLVNPTDDTGRELTGLEEMPKDPWGNEYGYEPPGGGETDPRIICFGADGSPGGENDEQDRDNFMIKSNEW